MTNECEMKGDSQPRQISKTGKKEKVEDKEESRVEINAGFT